MWAQQQRSQCVALRIGANIWGGNKESLADFGEAGGWGVMGDLERVFGGKVRPSWGDQALGGEMSGRQAAQLRGCEGPRAAAPLPWAEPVLPMQGGLLA